VSCHCLRQWCVNRCKGWSTSLARTANAEFGTGQPGEKPTSPLTRFKSFTCVTNHLYPTHVRRRHSRVLLKVSAFQLVVPSLNFSRSCSMRKVHTLATFLLATIASAPQVSAQGVGSRSLHPANPKVRKHCDECQRGRIEFVWDLYHHYVQRGLTLRRWLPSLRRVRRFFIFRLECKVRCHERRSSLCHSYGLHGYMCRDQYPWTAGG
jgi:hypothetical protein